ncbi:MAG TPA: SDR family NAD(P)-dependent oxidoreductase [Devosia sp.]|jgi:NAD(P)-dependent dehydrogenase (short-subunit alcohol dehydrogenase family)|uniref:SDR family NAD(P)-dependent oxidoreductase n=1 Tax=Devosia sp. TaxID=1871048 RepID=UPI002F944A19
MARETFTGTAWITGAGTGIGRGIALALAARGMTVAASARTEADLLSLAAEAKGPGSILPVRLDVTDEEAVRAAVARIEAEAGPITLAIINAGTNSEVTAQKFDTGKFASVMEINLLGAVYCLGALLPRLRQRRSGRIALVASVAGYRGLPTAAAYAASKAGLIAMTESLKPELEGDNVELTLINPGFVDTPLTRRNTFPMPFLIDTDAAVRAIMRGLERGRFEIVFPWQMTILMKLLGVLPYRPFFAITRRMVRRL